MDSTDLFLLEVNVAPEEERTLEEILASSEASDLPPASPSARCEVFQSRDGWIVEFWFGNTPYGRYHSPSTLIKTRFRRWPSNSA